MKFHSCFHRISRGVAIALLVTVSLSESTVSAGTFHWGDIAGTDVMFLDVTENNGIVWPAQHDS